MKSKVIVGVLIGAAAVTALLISSEASAQSTSQPSVTAAQSGVQAQVTQPKSPQTQETSWLGRYLDFSKFLIESRYRFREATDGTVDSNQLQYGLGIEGRIKIDSHGTNSVNFMIGTGPKFASGWNNVGIGNDTKFQGLPEINFEQFNFSTRPVKGIEFAVGGLGMARGLNSEVVSYDNDAYVVGSRLTVKRDGLYFDEISATVGNIGGYNEANVFARLGDLPNTNYASVVVTERLAKKVNVSLDVTYQAGATYLKEAAVIDLPKGALIDKLRLELYERVNPATSGGVGLTAEKKVGIYKLGAGYAKIDDRHDELNGDKYMRGQRVFASVAFPLTKHLTASAWWTHTVGHATKNVNNQRFDFVIGFDALSRIRQLIN